MSEEKTPGTAVAVRERLVTQAPVAIWDTADFEQMQRVAVVLTRSGLVPATLCKDGDEWLPEPVVAARCTLVCNQARLWGADPLNVLQCTSLINGRLMYEGKLIAAVVASMTGVKLRYRFGVWNKDHIEFPEDESGLHGVGDRLAVRCFDPDDHERFVDGSVGLWKTTRKGNPWESSNNWPRQLRYRASREWARAYEPGVILGILADGDQDIDELVMEAKPVGLMQRLKGTQEGDGFDNGSVQAQTEKPKRKGRPPKNPEPEEAMHASSEGEKTDTADQPETEIRQPELEMSTETEVVSSCAEPGEIYLLEGDRPNSEGRQLTYKDGVRFSTVMNPELSKLKTYPKHAPEIAEEDIPEHMRDDVAPASVEDAQAELGRYPGAIGEGEGKWNGGAEHPTETVSAPDAEPEPATSETATPASSDGPEASDSVPSAEAGEGWSLERYGDAIENCGSWQEVLDTIKSVFASDFWNALTPTQQNSLRGKTWLNLKEIGNFAVPDPITSLSAFRLFIEAETDPEAISGGFTFLQKEPVWKNASDGNRTVLEKAVAARLEALG